MYEVALQSLIRTLIKIAIVLLAFSLQDYLTSAGEPLFFYIEKPGKLSYTYEIRSSEAIGVKFPAFPIRNIALQYAHPSHACSSLLPLFDDAVLIERGECSFATKALHASKAGARVAIITDSASDSGKWIDMIGDGTGAKSDIPVAFLPGISGRRIRDYLMYGDGEVRITIPLNHSVYDFQVLQTKPPWEHW